MARFYCKEADLHQVFWGLLPWSMPRDSSPLTFSWKAENNV